MVIRSESSISLRKIMLFFIVFSIILPMLLFSFITYGTLEKNIEKSVSEYSLQLTKQIATNLELKLSGYKDMIIQVITNRNVISLLQSVEENSGALVENPKLSAQIIQYTSVAPEFKSIAFLSEGKYIKTIYRWDDRSLEHDIYEKTLENRNQFQWYGGRQQAYRDSFGSHTANVFSISKEVMDIVNGGSLNMAVVIDVQNKVLEKICDKISNEELPLTWCIIDPEGVVLFAGESFFNTENINTLFKENDNFFSQGTSPANYKEGWFEGKKLLVNSSELEVNDWTVITILDYEYIRQDAASSLRPVLIMFIMLLIILSAGMFLLVEKVAQPMNHLAAQMKYPMSGDFSKKVDNTYHGIEEIETLHKSYNFMLDEINNLVQEVYDKGEQKRIVQIKALESQINPHFLYNTLDTIKWTALLQKADNAASMTSMLSKLLHISLGKGRDLITVADEIEHVKAYIGIQKFRMDVDFDVVYAIDEHTQRCYVPKILLQPFVENCILHGFSEESKGFIEITCRAENDRLIFQVSDNGRGMDISQMDDLENSQNQKLERFSGIGVKNVNERIKLICGEDFGVTIKSKLGFGTTVIIELPVRREP